MAKKTRQQKMAKIVAVALAILMAGSVVVSLIAYLI